MPRNKELEIAYRILGGIPARKINLSNIVEKEGCTIKGKPFCGTIACGLGWLLKHPRYVGRGFGVRRDGWELEMTTPTERTWKHLPYDTVAAEMFGISEGEAGAIFATSSFPQKYDPPNTNRLSDKKLLLARIKNYLSSKE